MEGCSYFGSKRSSAPALERIFQGCGVSSVQTAAYQRFLRQLRKAREEAGLTQREVARALGKPPSFVAKCENGERRVDVVELSRFARAYRRRLSYFVE
jgi:ribosome-binding protein aMBF1 (putative translation factor)